jgi:hypothetical protein
LEVLHLCCASPSRRRTGSHARLAGGQPHPGLGLRTNSKATSLLHVGTRNHSAGQDLSVPRVAQFLVPWLVLLGPHFTRHFCFRGG